MEMHNPSNTKVDKADLFEFEASPVYIVSSRIAGGT